MPVADAPAISARVRRQYEYLPYPHRNPEDERKRLLVTGLDDLNAVNHYCYRGTRNFQAGFRALVAGGGTGDSVVFLAEQLRKTRAEIVYIDLSQASQTVARQRLRARGLEQRVFWIHGSLLDLPQMGLGRFDYINCSGVLHHLPDPNEGLAALRTVLKDDGALGLMVYGQYGRAGVYQMQSLFRMINDQRLELGEQVDEARAFLKTLPPSNWYQRGADLFGNVGTISDSELLDLFLHTQDRAYTVPQIYDFLDSAGLHLVEWSAESRIWYQPTVAFRDPILRARIMTLPRRDQEAACELFWGSLNKHALWATPMADSVASWGDADITPTWTRAATALDVRNHFLKCTDASWAIDYNMMGGGKVQLRLNVDDISRGFFELADGYRSKATILKELPQRVPSQTVEMLNAQCGEIFRLLNSHDLMVLRQRTVPFIPV